MDTVTIYHNPQCSTSRKTLELLRAQGITPQVIEYLRTPPERARLAALVAASGQGVRAFVRSQHRLYEELQLGAPGVSDAQLLDALAAHPELLQRPIVVTAQGTRVCRPVERVLEILPAPAAPA
ncbi:MAG: arsenate reductase (glutaredoxin) [Burkholderiales bacterium]|uniref:arsenate reductase (glutaredoxin) n=1 Tax=Comamonas granuli TaxID=290309 RepID=UPI0005A7AC3B|nr:arsenate reductase (glutaredoxin) [Comamonas granuli]MCZ2405601.1 arsenate reductase (glutaredoxin) [Burkholderiales bacterium]